MRLLASLTLLTMAAPASAQPSRLTFTCIADASGAGMTAQTRRLLDVRGDLRAGSTTSITVPLSGAGGMFDASWDVRFGLPKVERGIYAFRLPAPLGATWQLARNAKPLRAKVGLLSLSGKQFAALRSSGVPIEFVLVGRDGQQRARASLDRQAFDVALDLARQADAGALAKAADYRTVCSRSRG